MISFPNAKINLGLFITSKRKDGFHDINSVFAGVNWCDILEFIDAEETTFTSSGIEIPSNNDSNLVLQAYELLKRDHKLSPLKIHLEKIIPIGAGLGGGSSDASFMLKALNKHFSLNLTSQQLEVYALELGSDCPFFIDNKTSVVTGRGENLSPTSSINLNEYHIVLVNPNIHISTQEAYSNIAPHKTDVSLEEIINHPPEKWDELGLKNDFENSLFKKYPEIKSIKEKLYQTGALYASMSGSGSTVFSIYKKLPIDLEFDKEYQVFKGKFI